MLSIIVAHDRNRVIGCHGKLPWSIPQDLKRLKAVTMGKTIIMGRSTFESIGAALTGRRNIVISKDHTLSIENVEVVHEIDQLIDQFVHSDEECFVFGGQLIFEKFLPYVQKIYLTYIDYSFRGDRFFPVMEELEWVLVKKENGEDVNIPFEYTFLTFERRINNV